MTGFVKKAVYTLIGLAGLIAVICAVAYTCVTKASTMADGFERYASVRPDALTHSYEEYAISVVDCMTGKTDVCLVSENGESVHAFSEKEDLHMRDVAGLVQMLNTIRIAGGILVALICLAYLFIRSDREKHLSMILYGFRNAAVMVFGLALILCIWGLISFDSLFYSFHLLFFSNRLWLLNPNTDLLIQLMPTEFFIWYAKQILLALIPVLLCMAALSIAYRKISKEDKQ